MINSDGHHEEWTDKSPNHSALAGLSKVKLLGKTKSVEYDDHILLATQ